MVRNFSFGTVLLLISCTEAPSVPPTEFVPVEEVIVSNVVAETVSDYRGRGDISQKTMAVLSFSSPDRTQGGQLLSDMFSIKLKRAGISVIERDAIDRLIDEAELANSGSTQMTQLEIAERVGQLAAAQYILLGAVTVYDAEGELVYIPRRIKSQTDKDKYKKRYDSYFEKNVDKVFLARLFTSREDRIDDIREEDGVLSLRELEDELEKLPAQRFWTVANVGVTVKLVDVATSEIIWMGQAETTDVTLVGGASRVADALLSNLFAMTLSAPLPPSLKPTQQPTKQ